MDAMAKNSTKIASKLAFLLNREGITNTTLAAAIGVSHQQVSNYLAGSVPGGSVLAEIAKFFKVPLEWLLDDDAPANKPPRRFQYVNNDELMQEAAARYTEQYLKIMGYLDRAEQIPWESFADECQGYTPGVPYYMAPGENKVIAKLDVLFFLKTILQDELDPYDSASVAFRISRFGHGQLPDNVDVNTAPARMFIFHRIDVIHRRALTTEHAQYLFRWATTRAYWEEEKLMLLDKALQVCGV